VRFVAEMHQFLPWPFPDGEFPQNLGALIQKTVANGDLPALYVVHTPDSGWVVADGVNDPNVPGACQAMHIWHAIERNSSIRKLADLPPGWAAERNQPGDEWRRIPFAYEDENMA
jgi:hypothetical protein